MKSMHNLTIILAAVVLTSMVRLSAESVDVMITQPRPGSLIENRLDFPVGVSIANFKRDRAANFHYWVSLASVKGENELDQHWPKFYVKAGQSQGRISDGGNNPFPYPQKMSILLLKVDDSTNQDFIQWLEQGKRRGGYSGFEVKLSEIAVRIPITFP